MALSYISLLLTLMQSNSQLKSFHKFDKITDNYLVIKNNSGITDVIIILTSPTHIIHHLCTSLFHSLLISHIIISFFCQTSLCTALNNNTNNTIKIKNHRPIKL